MVSLKEQVENLKADLDERTKELTFMYSISDIVEAHGDNLETLLEEIIMPLPEALRYPEIAVAVLDVSGDTYRTSDAPVTEWSMSGDIIINGRLAGKLTVFYTEKRDVFDERVFLQEEEGMIRAFSERLGKIIGRVWSDQALVEKTREILKLSTPITKIWDEILILPLIGTLDSERTLYMMEELLNTIRDTGSRYIIMDATGVGTIDSAVAANILKTSRAVKMLGSQMIFTGIKPEVAMTMVHLGIDLGEIITRATLQEGVEYALSEKGLEIVRAEQMSE
ncbi:MAG: STAS domain-containing protein [Methanocalculus sp. MSAO_Arc1]|uniref:STAS domain-containing protein n=1 Tax=Methanocalculus TaxID=71151 RepID=UPI000FF1D83B|nr:MULTISPECIES: STAS domain-containing protein [unclassified Methanocalculus]MCP1661453.1 anti-anti-sigma regulatory factor [Methanocalculus sp. AMF5]RQD79268.1 MAG: STAS domain-containing protein [Methanocalculus sp. MSAO_Arc1]